MPEIDATTIAENAAAPAEVAVDGTRVKQHSIPDQIAAAKFAAAQVATTNRRMGLQFTQLQPPGCG